MKRCIHTKFLIKPNYYELLQGKPYTFPIADNKVIEFFQNKVTNKYEVIVRKRKFDDYFTKTTNNIYNPDLNSPELDSFLQDILVDENNNYDPELCEAIFVALGNILIGKPLDKIFIFLGTTAGNSKSTFSDAIAKVIGDFYGILNSDLITGSDKGYDESKPNPGLKGLYSKRGCFVSEMPKMGYVLNSLILKKLTSGVESEKLVTRDLYEKSIPFTNRATTFIVTNNNPDIDSSDSGILRRLIYFKFNAKFRPEDKIIPNTDHLSIEEKNKLMRENDGKFTEGIGYKKAIINYLNKVPQSFYHCFFNKMVEGALKALNGYCFSEKFMNEIKEEVKETCPLTAWMKNNLIYCPIDSQGKESYIHVEKLYENYESYCHEMNICKISRMLFDKRFPLLIKNTPYFTDVRKGKKLNKSAYINLRFIDSVDNT